MGVVYRARQLRLNRLVALKMIRDSALSSPRAIQRFRNEAEAAAALSHPNIVAIYECGVIEGHHFLSMRLVDGVDLGRALGGVPMDAKPLAMRMVRLARTLHHAHQRGVLHRDLKPANVVLDEAGEPHLTDFGLAKFTDDSGAAQHSLEIVGSPNYMAPEQAAGPSSLLTTSADVYSLGAIMYELLSGRPPFRAETPLETLRKVLEEDPIPPHQLYTFADRDLETICLKCMEKDPSRRYGSAEALAEELERWLRREPILARPISRPERIAKWIRRNPVTTSLLILLHVVLGSGLAGVLWMGYRANQNARESHERLVQMHVATGHQAVEDGDSLQGMLWFVEALRLETGGKDREENHRLRIAAAMNSAPHLLRMLFHGSMVSCQEYAPDGNLLATGGSDGFIRVWDLRTGGLAIPALPHAGPLRVVHFSPDGSKLLSVDMTGQARVWKVAGGQPLTPPLLPPDYDPSTVQGGVSRLRASGVFSPDGRKILTAWGSRAAHLWDAGTGRHLAAFPHDRMVHHAVFNRDGSRVVTSSIDQTARVWEVGTGRMLSVPLHHDDLVAWSEFSPDGTRLMTVSARLNLHVWDWARAREIAPVMKHEVVIFHAGFSPDGTRLMTVSWDRVARVWDANRGLLTAVFNHPGGLNDGVFSPDGRWVATSCHDGVGRVWSVEGGGLALPAMPGDSPLESVRFSPDGRHLSTCTVHGTIRIWELRPNSPSIQHFEHPFSSLTLFSPDRSRLVTASTTSNMHIRVWDVARRVETVRSLPSTSTFNSVAFSPDGRVLAIGRADGHIQFLDARTGAESSPDLVHPGAVHQGRFSPDGRSLATACADGKVRLWDLNTREVHFTVAHDGSADIVVFSPDGQWLASGSSDHTARLWRVSDGAPVCPPMLHPEAVSVVEFRPDGHRLVTATRSPLRQGTSVSLWDPRSGRVIGSPMAHANAVVSAEFDPRGQRLVTASADLTVRVWDAETGHPVSVPMWHKDDVIHALFNSTGRQVATLSVQGEVRIWDALTGEPITRSLEFPHASDQGSLAWSESDGLAVATGSGSVALLRLVPSTAPVETLLLQSQVYSGHRIDAAAGRVPLDESVIRERWLRLNPSTAPPR